VSVSVGERDNVCGRNYSRGVLFGLKRVWPPSVGCGHEKTEVLDEVRCCNPILDSPRFS